MSQVQYASTWLSCATYTAATAADTASPVCAASCPNLRLFGRQQFEPQWHLGQPCTSASAWAASPLWTRYSPLLPIPTRQKQPGTQFASCLPFALPVSASQSTQCCAGLSAAIPPSAYLMPQNHHLQQQQQQQQQQQTAQKKAAKREDANFGLVRTCQMLQKERARSEFACNIRAACNDRRCCRCTR